MTVKAALMKKARQADEEAGNLTVWCDRPPELGKMDALRLCMQAARAAAANPRLGSIEIDFTFSWEQHYDCIRPRGILSTLYELSQFESKRLKGLARDVFELLRDPLFDFSPALIDSTNKEVESFRIKIRWS